MAQHLPNLIRVHSSVYSGGMPETEAAFVELQSLGIKTVISVDGAKPNMEAATKHGLRYVHLPHGYDGISDRRAQELGKAVRDLPGPIYIHCHHGKHRSPTAAAVACVVAGMLKPTEALPILRTAGTSEHYRGLYESARKARPVELASLDAMKVDFPSVAKLPEMAQVMVEVEHVHGHLTALERSKWKSLPTKPDLIPEHEALLLRESFTELLRSAEVQRQPDRFRELLRDAESHAQSLETALRNRSMADAGAAFERSIANCRACHEQFRDIPLSEKSAK